VAGYTILSLFSGALGLDIGLERSSRLEIACCVEVDPVSCATIRHNRDAGRLARSDVRVIEADISALDPLAVLEIAGLTSDAVDMIVGGPPCQAFSVFGKRRGLEDARGQLIFEFMRFVEVVRPRVFLMENVRGLLSLAYTPGAIKGSLFTEIQQRFQDMGYHTDCFLVNAANYGAPQIRERMLMIGNRFNLVADFPPPTHSNRSADRLPPFATLGDAIRDQPDPDRTIMDFSPRKKDYLALVPPGGNWRSLPIEIQKESMGKSWYLKGGRSAYWRKLSYEFPSPTIVTMPNHAGTSLCHPEELRPLSVGECALIQGFPAHWKFAGTPAEKYRQVGNAVPIVLSAVAGQVCADLLENITGLAGPVAGPVLPSRVVHLRPHVRTRWWWKDGKVIDGVSYTEHPGREAQAVQLALFEQAVPYAEGTTHQ